MNEVLECVVFATIEGVDRDDFMEAAEASMQWARAQEGFVSRELFETDDGRWIDTVRWASMDAAHRAAAGIGTAPATQAFVSKIDGPSVQMMHARRAANA